MRLFGKKPLLQEALGKYLSDDDIRRIEAGEEVLPPLAPKTLRLSIIQFRDDDVDRLASRLAQAVEIAVKYGVVESGLSAFLVVSSSADADTTESLGRELLAAFGNDVKLLTTTRACMVGLIGGPSRFFYGSLVPNFAELLKELLALDFGELKQL